MLRGPFQSVGFKPYDITNGAYLAPPRTAVHWALSGNELLAGCCNTTPRTRFGVRPRTSYKAAPRARTRSIYCGGRSPRFASRSAEAGAINVVTVKEMVEAVRKQRGELERQEALEAGLAEFGRGGWRVVSCLTDSTRGWGSGTLS